MSNIDMSNKKNNHSLSKKRSNEVLILGWMDPRNDIVHHAGVAFYNPNYGEYLLKIDEEPNEKQYFLKAFECSDDGSTSYRMELVIKRKNGQFLKRKLVGLGHRHKGTYGNVFIDYGSKFKTLVLYLKEYPCV